MPTARAPQTIFCSATPRAYELERSGDVVEQGHHAQLEMHRVGQRGKLDQGQGKVVDEPDHVGHVDQVGQRELGEVGHLYIQHPADAVTGQQFLDGNKLVFTDFAQVGMHAGHQLAGMSFGSYLLNFDPWMKQQDT